MESIRIFPLKMKSLTSFFCTTNCILPQCALCVRLSLLFPDPPVQKDFFSISPVKRENIRGNILPKSDYVKIATSEKEEKKCNTIVE